MKESTGHAMTDEAMTSQTMDLPRFILHLRSAGILDTSLLRAVENTPRAPFLPPETHAQPYGSFPIALEEGQEAPPPLQIVQTLSHLCLKPSMRVLEIGTGSGYQTALLARLAKRVCTMERRREISLNAQKAFETLKIENIIPIIKDGAQGWDEQSPFDCIIANVAFPSLADALLNQLKEDGVLLLPILAPEQTELMQKPEENHAPQTLFHITKQAQGILRRSLGESRFPPLEEGLAGRPQPSY